ncbi:MAG TPA: acetate--CoA ligase [Acidimicrobiales bacterium]|nr:acetate--CoA ligase [Acidimicrobiales bacterium]
MSLTPPWPTIRKARWPGGVTPNVVDYDAARAAFTWEAARRDLDGLPGGRGLNMAHEAVDRHATGLHGERVAVCWLRRSGEVDTCTYRELAEATDRFANVLRSLGVGRGDAVFTLLGRVPELHVAVLGTLKNTSVVCPLFPAFGPEPVRQRLAIGDGRVLVTTPDLYRRRVAPVRHALPRLEHVLLVGGDGVAGPEGGLDLAEAMATAPGTFTIPPTDPEDAALLHFTSGSTGTPKGALHVHDAVVAHHATGRTALDLHDGDVFWCTADPGWVTGLSYGVIAPLTHGVTCVVDEGEFEAQRWYRVLGEAGVSVWYTAPTALRLLMRAGPDLAAAHDLSTLRFVASVGEPLNPEVVSWGQDVLGVPVHDTWWQTETGAIMIANLAGCDIRPGSMGRPLPGVEAAVLARGAAGRAAVRHGRVRVVDRPGVEGELALRPGWPSMFRGYVGDDAGYAASFAGGWYLTGDVVRHDEDGWLWFVGRADDVITSAGHLIGPFEVESALMAHEAVVEAGVIGVPDPVAGEVVKAFVTLAPGHEPTDDLRLDLLGFARARLGPAVAPRLIAFDQHLPRTRSGKILRRLLKARELGLPEGDLSTLDVPP